MSLFRGLRLTATLCLLLALCCLGAATARAAMGAATVQQTKLVGPYKLVLMIGPLERMCSAAQARQMSAKCTEVMVRGAMAMGGMHGPMPNRHLELHVYDRTNGKTIANAMVALIIRTASGKLVARVPIAVMYGIKEGKADLHYGNNVALKAGHYHVVAQVEAITTTFDVMLGGSSMSGM